jgi:hypothetical protein
VARPEGLEPPAYWFEANRSIQLSYGRVESIPYKFTTVLRGIGLVGRFEEFLNERKYLFNVSEAMCWYRASFRRWEHLRVESVLEVGG